jgi:hypothetical protein
MKKFLNFIILLIIAILVIPVFLPGSKHFEQTITINQSIDKTFNAVMNLNNWANWFKEIRQDTCCKITIFEPTDSSKAKITWQAKHGNGSLILKKTVKDSLLLFKMKLHHHRKACLQWLFKPVGDSTQVTVTFNFNLCYISRIFGIFIDDKLSNFMHTTLKSFQTFVEALPHTQIQTKSTDVSFEEISMEEKPALAIESNHNKKP